MTCEDAKDFIDGQFAVTDKHGEPFLRPVDHFPGGSVVTVDADDSFSALQLLGDARRYIIRHEGLHRALSKDVVRLVMTWPGMSQEWLPSIVRGRWGGVLVHRTHYCRMMPTDDTFKHGALSAAYGGANLNGNFYRQMNYALGQAWANSLTGIPKEMLEAPRSNCLMIGHRWRWQRDNG